MTVHPISCIPDGTIISIFCFPFFPCVLLFHVYCFPIYTFPFDWFLCSHCSSAAMAPASHALLHTHHPSSLSQASRLGMVQTAGTSDIVTLDRTGRVLLWPAEALQTAFESVQYGAQGSNVHEACKNAHANGVGASFQVPSAIGVCGCLIRVVGACMLVCGD